MMSFLTSSGVWHRVYGMRLTCPRICVSYLIRKTQTSKTIIFHLFSEAKVMELATTIGSYLWWSPLLSSPYFGVSFTYCNSKSPLVLHYPSAGFDWYENSNQSTWKISLILSTLQEYVFTVAATVLYALAFIVLLAGFGYCAGGNQPKCDARVAAGVSF